MTIVRMLLLVCLLPLASCVMVPTGPAAVAGVEVEKDVVFSFRNGSEGLKADVWKPKDRPSAPGVLLLHGGGLTDTGGKWQMNGIAAKLAKRGYVVVNATYRTAPAHRYPVPQEDVKAALDWMRKDGAKYGIDRSRIATFGYSAGGYLASLVALTDDAKKDRVKAIVAGGAPSDLVFYASGKLVPDFLGGKLYDVPQRFYEASPANHVKRSSPPIFIYHGMKDKLVKPEHPMLMLRKYQDAGAKSEHVWLWDRGHIGAFVFSDAVVDKAIDFLDREL